MFDARSFGSPSARRVVPMALVMLTSGLVPVLAPWLASPAAATPNTTQLVSVAQSGVQGDHDAQGNFSLSAGGRLVAFDSQATNLIPGLTDANNASDIFVRNLATNQTELISVSTTGGFGNGNSQDPTMSADGRYVAFTSLSSNLVAGDTNNAYDVFVRDRVAGATERVSVSTAGAEGNQGGFGPRISQDGRYVVFGSDATNLVANDTNGTTDVFLRDRLAGTTERVSVSTAGAQGNGGSGWPSVSADGRYVAFYSSASTLLDSPASDSNNAWDIFLRDRTASPPTTTRVSVASNGTQAIGGSIIGGSVLPSMSADGRYIVYYSDAANLVSGDNNAERDVFLWDRQTAVTTRISVGTGGADSNGGSLDPNISRDGRYITFSSGASNVVSSDGNSAQDEFVYDRLAGTPGTTGATELVSVSSSGVQGNQISAGRADISADGRYVVFWSRATTLATDNNGFADDFVRERDPQQAPLVGGAVGPETRRGGGSPSMLVDCPAPDAEPCDLSTGNFFDTTPDLSIPGRGMGLEFTRTYNSYPSPAAPADGPLGYGWSFNYGMSLTTGTNPTVTEENGAQITFTGSGPYTAPARVQATLSLSGGVWTFTRKTREIYKFNSSGQLISAQDLNGNVTNLAYGSGKLTTVTDPAGRTLTLGWNGTHIASVTDTASPARSVTFTYTSSNLTDVVDVGGGHTQYGYDANHRMTTKREPNFYGNTTANPTPVTTNHYDGSGRIDSQTDPVGRQTTFDYTSIAGSTKITDPKGNVRVDAFTSGLLTARTLGYGTSQAATWVYGYDPATLARTLTVDPNAGVTTTIDDTAGDALVAMDELGRTTVTTYNGLRESLTVRDPTGVVTSYLYDGNGNLTQESTPLVGSSPAVSKTTNYSIDTTPGRVGDVLSMTDPDGKVWPRTWDSSGNLATEADPLGNTTRYCYDTVGRKTKEISPKGTAAGVTCTTANPTFTTLMTTDAFGAEVAATDANGNTTQKSYDLNRNEVSTTDALGAVTTSTYNAANELVEQTNPWSVLLRDDFTGTSGPWNTARWGATSGVALSADQGVMTSAATPARATAKTMPDTLDSEATFTYQFSATGNSTLRAALRASGADKASGADMPNAYRLEINPSTAQIQLTKVIGGTVTNLGSPVGYASGTAAQRVRFQVQGSTIRAKVWTAASNEPSTWTVSAADTANTFPGVMQLSNLLVSGSAQNAIVDDLQVLDPATQGAWQSPVRVSDDFTGTSGAVWNTNTWATTTGVTISSNQGSLAATTASVRATAKAMPDVLDSEANFTYFFDNTTSATTLRVSLRASGADKTTSSQMTTGYRLEITPSTSAVHIKKIVNSTLTDLGQFNYSLTGSTPQQVRFQVQGSTIRARIWALGTSEPSTWSLSVSDSEITTPGVLQLANSFSSTASTVTVDDLSVMVANSLRWDYNGDGTVFHEYDGAGQATTYGYDPQARLTTVTDPLSRTTTYGYDPAGNRTTKQDPGGNCGLSSGCTTTTYDAAGQAIRIDYSDAATPDVTRIDYDLDGRRTRMTDGTGTSTWVWDSLGRLTSQTNGAGKTIGYGYDLRANRTSIIYPGTTGTVTQTFDNASRMTKVTDWLTHQTTFNYDADSFMTSQVYPNGTTATYTPDAADRLMTVSHAPTSSPGSPFAKFDYGRDNNDRLTSVASTGLTDNRTWTYTPHGRLRSENGGLYTIDDADNATKFPSGATLAYDAADQLTSFSDATSGATYGYDGRGNRTSVTPTGGGSLHQLFSFDPASAAHTYPVSVGGSGTLNSTLDWNPTTPATTTGNPSGNLAAAQTSTSAMAVDGKSRITGAVTWQQGNKPVTATTTPSVPAAGSVTTTISPTGTGTISADLTWAATTAPKSFTGTAAPYPATESHTVTATGNGTLDFTLSWNGGLVGGQLGLNIWDGTTLCGQNAPLVGSTAHVTCPVTGLGSYPSSHDFRLEVTNSYTGSYTYTLSGTYPATPTLDFELDNNAGTRLVGSTIVSATPHRTLSYPNAAAGTYKLKITSSDLAATPTQSETHYNAAYADLTLALKDPGGTTVASTRTTTGSANIGDRTLASGGAYTWSITNNSTDVSAAYQLNWSTTTLADDTSTGSIAAGGTASRNVTADGPGYATGTLTWPQGNKAVTSTTSPSVAAGGSTTTTITPTGTGTISADLTWSPTAQSASFSGSVDSTGTQTQSYNITPSANGTISFNLTWSTFSLADLDLFLYDGTTLLASSQNPIGFTSESVSYTVSSLGSYPSSHTYRLDVTAFSGTSSYTLSGSYPVTPTLDFELDNSAGTRLAGSTIVSATPHRTLSYPNAAAGTYKLKITSSDLAATTTQTETHYNAAFPDLTLTLKDPGGTTVASARSSTGSLTLPDTTLAAAGTYTAQITNNSTDTNVPSYSLTVTVPQRRAAAVTLQLKDPGGTVMATAAAAKPESLSASVTAGAYSLVATSTSGSGDATLDATFPAAAGSPYSLTYDQANRLTAYGGTATYTDNGDGTRMSKTVSGTATAFTWGQGSKLLVEGSTNYIYGRAGRPLEQITASGTVTYYHQDALGSTRALTNGSGATVATYTYSSLGKVTSSTGSATNPLQFVGQYTDSESGLIYAPSGYYDPQTAQSISPMAKRTDCEEQRVKCYAEKEQIFNACEDKCNRRNTTREERNRCHRDCANKHAFYLSECEREFRECQEQEARAGSAEPPSGFETVFGPYRRFFEAVGREIIREIGEGSGGPYPLPFPGKLPLPRLGPIAVPGSAPSSHCQAA